MIPRLLCISDLASVDASQTLMRADAVLRRAGARAPAVAFSIRDHTLTAARRHAFGLSLAERVRANGAQLWVHDRLDLALALGADGVQLGFRSVDVASARRLLGRAVSIGVSAHDADELARAQADGADCVTLSPVLASPGKAAPIGLTGARALIAKSALPTLLLGGVDAGSVRALSALGAAGVAAIRGWLVDPAFDALVDCALEAGVSGV